MTDRLFPRSAEALGLLRIWVFGIWTVRVLRDPVTDLAWLPREIFHAPGLLKILPDSFWSHALSQSGLLASKVMLLFCLLGSTLGVLPRLLPMGATLLLVYYQGLLRGFGHVNHAEIPFLYAAFLLALSPCADAFAVRRSHVPPRHPQAYAAPFLLIMAALCLSYLFVGVNRIVHGQSVFRAGTLPYWLILSAYRDTGGAPALGRFIHDYPLLRAFMEWGFHGVTALEIAAPLCLLSRRVRLVFWPLMGLFHVFTWLAMDLLFWANLALFPVFFDLDRLVERLRGARSRPAIARRAAEPAEP